MKTGIKDTKYPQQLNWEESLIAAEDRRYVQDIHTLIDTYVLPETPREPWKIQFIC